MRNIKFALEQIKREVWDMLFKVLQLIVTFIILVNIAQVIAEASYVKKLIGEWTEQKQVFMFRSTGSDKQYGVLVKNDRDTILKHQTIIDEMLGGRYLYTFIDNALDDFIIQNKKYIRVGVTKDFFEQNHLDIPEEVQKKFEITYDINEDWEKKVLPAVVGSSLSKKYKIGDIVEDDSGRKIQIEAFLKKGARFVRPTQQKEPFSLDKSVIIPVNVDKSSVYGMDQAMYSCQLYVNNEKELKEIRNVMRQQKVTDGYFVNYSSQIKVIENDYVETIILYSLFGSILLIFSFVSMICLVIRRVSECAYEYGINLLCGARITDIWGRVFIENLLLIVLSLLVTTILCGISEFLLLPVLICLGCFIILFLYMIHKIQFEKLTDTLRGVR